MDDQRISLDEYRQRFKLVPFDEIRIPTECPYLVKGIIPREGLVVVWGPPKCGKSFWLYDLSMCVARGWEYRGRRVVQGPVVYVACEGERGLGARTEAYRRERLQEGATDIPFYLVTTRLDMIGEHRQLIADITAQIGDTVPVLVVTRYLPATRYRDVTRTVTRYLENKVLEGGERERARRVSISVPGRNLLTE